MPSVMEGHLVACIPQAVLQALEQVSSLTGWELFQVGGSRRVKVCQVLPVKLVSQEHGASRVVSFILWP